MDTADQTSTDDPIVPVALILASLEGGLVEYDDDGRPFLRIRDGGVVKAKLVTGDDHREDRAGMRRLIDGIGVLQYEVMSQELKEEREARLAAAGEPVAVDDAQLEATAGNSAP